MGMGLALLYLVIARYFGRKAFGSVRGSLSMFMMPAGVAAPIYLGWAYDTSGSYITAFTLLAGLIGFAAVLAFFILPPKPPSQITDIRKIV
jgi:nitrate/nitrite transporter NarK